MGTGYVRNDTANNIADGNIINAADLDGEFDAIEAAFATTGHTHDGTAAEGGAILVLGPTQEFVVSSTEAKPSANAGLSLGTSLLQFNDLYIDGKAYIDGLGESILVDTTSKIQFRDTALFINSSADGQLDLEADTTIELTAPTVSLTNDLKLKSDAAVLSFGADDDITVTHVHNTGLDLKNATGFDLNLQTSDTTVESGNLIGKITFNAPDEASGTDAILVGASIEALAEATFDSATNSTALVFKTNTTGAATERMRLTSAGDLHFLDNRKAIFGAGSDLQIYHSGSVSLIDDVGTGNLVLKTNGTKISLQNDNGGSPHDMVTALTSGAVQLRYSSDIKLATTATGIDVTGTVTADGLTGDSLLPLNITAASGRAMNLYANGGTLAAKIASTGDISFYEDTGTTAKFFWDASTERLGIGNAAPATTLDVTGTVTADGLDVDGIVTITDGNVRFDLMESDTTDLNGRLQNTSGLLQIRTLTDAKDSAKDRIVINHSTGDILFYEDTGTTAKFFWDASVEGLGIGDTSFTNKLNVTGAMPSAGTPLVQLFENSGSARDGLYLDYTGTTNSAVYSLKIADATKTHIAVRGDGNVGIGTSSPSRLLDVNGIAKASIFDAGGEGFIRGDASGELRIQSGTTATTFRNNANNTEYMRIDSSGNVGIGTTSPDYKLEVEEVGTGSGLGGIAAATATAGGNAGYRWVTGGTARFGMTTIGSAGSESLRIYDNNNSSERMRIDSSGRVGIGTSSPAEELHVETTGGATAGIQLSTTGGTVDRDWKFLATAAAGTFYIQDATASVNRLAIDTSGNVGIGTSSPVSDAKLTISDTNSPHIYFQRSSSGAGDAAIGMPSSAALAFYTPANQSSVSGLSEAMRIDSSGDLLVGKTSQSVDTVGGEILSSGIGQFTVDGNFAGRFTRQTSDGDIVVFRKGTGTVGSIGAVSGEIAIGSNTTGVRFTDAADRIDPWNITSNTARDGAIDLGTGARRFKDLYLSGGVVFGSTGGSVTSKTLDDYEEGTFGVTAAPNTSGTVTLNVSYNTLSYTKIGRVVTINGELRVSAVSSPVGTRLVLSNLPFTVADLDEYSGRANGATYGYINSTVIAQPFRCPENNTDIWLDVDCSTLGSGNEFGFSFSYQTT